MEAPAAERARRGALLKRAASKSDVADQAVAFARTNTITGQTIAVEGGAGRGMNF